MRRKELFNFFIVPLGGAVVKVEQDVHPRCCPKSWRPRSVYSLVTSDLSFYLSVSFCGWALDVQLTWLFRCDIY